MQIRRLTPADAPAFRALRLRALREHPDAFTSSYEEDAPQPLQIAALRLGSATQAFWGACQRSELYGMIGLEREIRAKKRHLATVIGMYVAPEARGQGAGRALLAALLAHARSEELAALVLTVTEDNAGPLHLYQAAGFRSFGVQPDAIRIAGRSLAKNHMHLDLSSTP